jgi:hypothetical protein
VVDFESDSMMTKGDDGSVTTWWSDKTLNWAEDGTTFKSSLLTPPFNVNKPSLADDDVAKVCPIVDPLSRLLQQKRNTKLKQIFFSYTVLNLNAKNESRNLAT